MATLADLTAMRDALEKARYAGVRQVQLGNSIVSYKSDAEMKAALNDLNRKISVASGSACSPFVTFTTSKGL